MNPRSGLDTPDVPLPNDAALRGVQIWSQGAVEDPLGPAFEFTFTGGRHVTLGE